MAGIGHGSLEENTRACLSGGPRAPAPTYPRSPCAEICQPGFCQHGIRGPENCRAAGSMRRERDRSKPARVKHLQPVRAADLRGTDTIIMLRMTTQVSSYHKLETVVRDIICRCVYIYIYIHICVCVCMLHIIHVNKKHIYIYIYTYIVCGCLVVHDIIDWPRRAPAKAQAVAKDPVYIGLLQAVGVPERSGNIS